MRKVLYIRTNLFRKFIQPHSLPPMKLTSRPSVLAGIVLLTMHWLFPASQTTAQSGAQPATFGNYSLTLPPGWQYDPAGSGDAFLAFNYTAGGKTGYVIKIKKQPVSCPTKKDFNREVVTIFYDLYGAQDYVDRFKNEGDYGALGDSQSHFISFNVHGSNERGFILSPWVNGTMYNIYIFDKLSQKRELRPEALAFLGALTVNKSATTVSGTTQDTPPAQAAPVPAVGTQQTQADPAAAGTQPPQTAPSAAIGTQPAQTAPSAAAGTQPAPSRTGMGTTTPPGTTTAPTIPGTAGTVSSAGKRQGPPPADKSTLKTVIPPHLLQFGKITLESDIDFATMTSAQYAGAVSMAMEGMRLIYGAMSTEEENRFYAGWKPLFDYPCSEVADYLNRLNPMISEFLALREAMGAEIESYNAAVLVVTMAAAEDDTETVAGTMAELEITVAVMNTLQKQIQEVAGKIADLGNPPDASSLAAGRRTLHRKALSMISVNNFPFEGEWELEDGSSILMKVVKVFDDGKVLVYRFPVSALEKWEAEGIDISKPGIEYDEKTKGMTMIPGVYDLLIMFEPMDDGSWATLDWSFIRFISIYRGDREEIEVLQYRPPNELNNSSGVNKYSLTRTTESYPVPPVLPIDGNPAGWDQLLKVVPERKWDQGKYDAYMKWRAEFPEELAMAVRGGPAPLEERQRLYLGERKKIDDEYAAKKAAGVSENDVSLMVEQLMYLRQLPESERPRLEKDVRQQLLEGIDQSYKGQVDLLNRLYADIFEPVSPEQQPVPEVSEALVDYLKALKDWETDEAVRKQKEEQVKFHENNMLYFDRNIESLKGKLAGSAVDPETRNSLTRDLLYQMDAKQKEQDAIMTIKTGEYVHTRTDLDALNMQMMAERGRQMAEVIHSMKRTMERMPKLIEMAPPDERQRLREFFERNMTAPDGSGFDPGRMRKAAATIGDQVIGTLEKSAAEKEEWAAAVTGITEGIEYVKTGADVSMTLLSVAAPVYFAHTAPNAIAAGMRAANAAKVFFGYQAASGYIDGGVTGAFTSVASSYNTVTMMANAAMNGYQRGVLEHLEEHARDAGNVTLNETSAGLWGMGWDAGKEALKTVVFKAALGALMPASPKGSPSAWSDVVDARGNPVNPSSARWPTVQQQVEAARFVSRQAEGRAKVNIFRERMQRLSDAGKAGAPKEQIDGLRSSAEEAYKSIKTDLYAKGYVNSLARQGDASTTAHYNSFDRSYTSRLRAEVEQELVNAGFNKQKCLTFSNSSSKGKVGADLDLGVAEPPRYTFDASGKRIPNPEHIAWRRSLTVTEADGTIRRSSPQELQKAGQEILERSFAKLYGRPPGEAMVEFTTSYHPEAYRDLAWLGSKGTKTALVFETNRAWVQQAADVSMFKVNNLPANHPQLGYYGIMQEQMRGLTKDFNTKIEPMLRVKAAANPDAARHLYDLRDTMDKFARNEIGPIEAEHRIRELTGGRGMAEVAEQLAVAMGSLRSMIK